MFLSITVADAQWNKKIKGNGNVVTVERTTDDYDGISVDGFYEIELVEGIEGELKLTGEDNILDKLVTEVKNGTLVIKRRKNLILIPSKGKGVFITVPVKHIDKIRSSGSGSIIGKKALESDKFDIQVSGSRNIGLNIDTNNLSIATSGSSNIDLNGNCGEFHVRSSGSSNIKAYRMEVGEATLELSGSSDVELTVHESLISRISGSGNIRYKGNPDKIRNTISGSGSVSKN